MDQSVISLESSQCIENALEVALGAHIDRELLQTGVSCDGIASLDPLDGESRILEGCRNIAAERGQGEYRVCRIVRSGGHVSRGGGGHRVDSRPARRDGDVFLALQEKTLRLERVRRSVCGENVWFGDEEEEQNGRRDRRSRANCSAIPSG